MLTSKFTLFLLLISAFSGNFSYGTITLRKLKDIISAEKLNGSAVYSKTFNVTNSSNPYCHLCCIDIEYRTVGRFCGSHTLCKYPTTKTGPACRGYIYTEFSDGDREALVDAHNILRNNVAGGLESEGSPGPQPKAANMRVIHWSVELAKVASRWARQCIYGYDVCRDLERFPVGQNIAQGSFTTNTELSFIKSWYDQVSTFNSSMVKTFKLNNEKGEKRKMPYESYTQLVWADTYEIGCARAIFQVSQDAKLSYVEHFICNYGPLGNIPEQSVYELGAPCSACPEGTSCSERYPSLCEDKVTSALSNKREEQVKLEEKPTTQVQSQIVAVTFPYNISQFLSSEFPKLTVGSVAFNTISCNHCNNLTILFLNVFILKL